MTPRSARPFDSKTAPTSANAAAAPSGVVTFLFTDVEGSTRRWEADAEAMRAALAANDEALRTAIEAHGGWLFKHTIACTSCAP
jgi:class 3 adenylate cyclase